MYGGGGVFGTQNTKVTCILLYNKGGCLYFIPNHKSINGTFVHTFHKKIIKNYEKMPNFHSPGNFQNSSIACGFHNVLTLYFSIQIKYITYRSDI